MGRRDDGRRSVADSVRRLSAATADDRVTGVAAEVAFYGFLGIFPGLLALAAALGFLEVLVGADVADQAQQVVVDFLSGFLGEGATATVDSVEALFGETDVALLSFASVGALWSTWRAARATVRALGVVYDAGETRSAARVAAVALGVALSTLVLAAVMLVMFVLGPLLGGGRGVAAAVGLGDVFAALWTWARIPFGFAVLVGWAAMLFRITPDRTSTLRDELPGAVATGVLWLLFSAGFQLYLRVAGGANQVLGVIGGAMTVLVWLYLLSLGLLLGAEINAVIAHGRASRHRVGRPRRRHRPAQGFRDTSPAVGRPSSAPWWPARRLGRDLAATVMQCRSALRRRGRGHRLGTRRSSPGSNPEWRLDLVGVGSAHLER